MKELLSISDEMNRRTFLKRGVTTGLGLSALPVIVDACSSLQSPDSSKDAITSNYPELANHAILQDLNLATAAVPVRIVNYAPNLHVDPIQATQLYNYLHTLQPRQAEQTGSINGAAVDKNVYTQEPRSSLKKSTVVIVGPDVPKPQWFTEEIIDGGTAVPSDGTATFSVIRAIRPNTFIFPNSLAKNVLLAFAVEAAQQRFTAGETQTTTSIADTEWWNNSLGFALAYRAAGMSYEDYSAPGTLFLKGTSIVPAYGKLNYYEFSQNEYNAMPPNNQIFSEIRHK